VSYYGGAEKISKAALQMINPITQALYPRMNHLIVNNVKKAKVIAKITFLIYTVLSILFCLVIITIAPFAIDIILGNDYHEAVPVLRILSLLIPLIAMSNVLGIQWMLPNNMDRVLNKIIISAGFVNVILAIYLAPAFQAKGMAVSVVISEAFVTTSMMFIIRINTSTNKVI
jgi:PST family polysaccharide transporter